MNIIFLDVVWVDTKLARFILYFLPVDHSSVFIVYSYGRSMQAVFGIRNSATCSFIENMYEDLEAIANLKFGEVVERISRERQGKLSAQIADLAARGLANSRPMVLARLNSALEMSERTCRALYEIWLELILQRNEGKITREDVDFIMGKVNPCTQTRAAHIAQALESPEGPAPQWAMQQAQTKMQSVS